MRAYRKTSLSTLAPITLFLLAVSLQPSFAQQESVTRETQIYKTVGGDQLTVDIFYPPGPLYREKNPALAFFHGGGWVFGHPQEFHGACMRYAIKGFVTFSFQYRLSMNPDETYPNPHITPIESVKDARSAVRWIRTNATLLKIDPDRIVVSGQSAGGQLAWSTALFDDINESTDDLEVSPVPNALVLYSSCYNTMEAWVDWLLGDRRDQIWSISPYHNLKRGLPPALAFHGRDDCTVLYYSVELFEKKTHELGNQFELITLEGRKHYLGEGNTAYSRLFDEAILERTDKFLGQLGFMRH